MNNALMTKARQNIEHLRQCQGKRPPTPTWAAHQRRMALYNMGLTQRDLAADLKVSPEAVSQCINNERSSRRIATRLAELTGHSLSQLWPCGRYADWDSIDPSQLEPIEFRHYALWQANTSQQQVAQALDISPEAVNHCVSGRAKSQRVANYIANITGYSLEKLWPCGKYQEHAQ